MSRPPKIPYDEIPKMKFGRLNPIRMVFENGRTKWLCKCDCGNETIVIQKNLCNGNTKSCGCLNVELNGMRTHSLSNTRLYTMFCGVKARCYNPNNISYKWYGEKDVRICEEWLQDFKKFYDWSIQNGYDETLPRGAQTLDRKDTNGDYSPDNCRWITIQQQQRNKENNVTYELNGEKHLLCEWAEILGVDYGFLKSRVGDYGWTLEQALKEPFNAKINLNKARIKYKGENLTIKEWSEKLGISEKLIRSRMQTSKDPEHILRAKKGERKDSIIIEYKGKEQNLKEWSRELDINYGTLKSRIKRGWSAEQALSTSIRKKRDKADG